MDLLRMLCALPVRSLRTFREEGGQVLILFAGGLVAFLGIVGLSIDVGQLMHTRTDLQKLADASALAGAQDLPLSTANATTAANAYSTKNGGATTAITFGIANSTITVKATRHVDYMFLRVVGLTGLDVSAAATAKAIPVVVTGYKWNAIAPFVIWGGPQAKPPTANASCKDAFRICVGKSYTFWSNAWRRDSGDPSSTPTQPGWTVNDPSNNFKGVVNHGAGDPALNQIGDFFTDGGNGPAVAPADGSIIVVPVVDRASGGSSSRQFHIAAWVIIRVDPGCTKGGSQPCTGTVLNPATTTPPAGYVGGGAVAPPPVLTYTSTDTRLIS